MMGCLCEGPFHSASLLFLLSLEYILRLTSICRNTTLFTQFKRTGARFWVVVVISFSWFAWKIPVNSVTHAKTQGYYVQWRKFNSPCYASKALLIRQFEIPQILQTTSKLTKYDSLASILNYYWLAWSSWVVFHTVLDKVIYGGWRSFGGIPGWYGR